MQLVARGDAADVDRMLELEQPLLDGAVALDQLARMAGRGLQFLVELADLDRELAHHAHQVVEQLGGHARGGLGFAARGRRCRARSRGSRRAASGRRFEHALAHRVRGVVVARGVEQFDDGERVLRRRVFAGHRGHHLLEAVGGGHERLRAHGRGRGALGFADFEDVFEAMRELGDAADAEDVGRALERVRGAFGIAQQFGLRGVGDPALQRLRDFGGLRRRVVQEGVEQRGVDVARDVERAGRRPRALPARPVRSRRAPRRCRSRPRVRRAARSARRHRAAAAPSRRRNGAISDSIGRGSVGVAQVRFEQLRPIR